jgi:glycosyltransferase involved in cell wall biosynthesis
LNATPGIRGVPGGPPAPGTGVDGNGLPAVVADATGSNALVSDGVTGFLAEPRNAGAFREKVELLIHDATLRSRMSNAARAAAERYDWNHVLGTIKSYYGELGE